MSAMFFSCPFPKRSVSSFVLSKYVSTTSMKYSYAQGCLLLGLHYRHAGPAEMLRTKKKAVINTQLYTSPTVHCALQSKTHTCNSLYSVARYDTIAPMFLCIGKQNTENICQIIHFMRNLYCHFAAGRCRPELRQWCLNPKEIEGKN